MKLLSIFFLLNCCISGIAQNVGIGTTTPAVANKLHVHGPGTDISVGISNGITTDGSLRGTRLRALNSDFFIINQEALGRIGLTTGGFERLTVSPDGNVGIGTTNPAPAYQIHAHGELPASEVSIGMTNSFTTDANLRGTRIRMNAYDFSIQNYEASGKIGFVTGGPGGIPRLTILPSGFIGINQPNPTELLHIEASTNNDDGIFINHTGSDADGMRVLMTGGSTNVMGINAGILNNSGGSFYAYAVRGRSGTGGPVLGDNLNYGVVGENLNTVAGSGVFGGTSAPAGTGYTSAGILGLNWSSTINDAFGVIGKSSGLSGAGVGGFTSSAGAVGVLGRTQVNNATAIKAEVRPGFSGTALDISNGAIKVSGTNRPVFIHATSAGNTTANYTIIPNTTLANSFTDILIVTPFWDAVYVNAPIGVYFEALDSTWRIFRQDLQPMPLNAKFNVLVFKQ
jgi:hypothetical protein